MTEDNDEKIAQEWLDRKTAMMVELLGREHDTVMHALIPYFLGGPLDLYYFPEGIPGTAIATKEVSELPGQGSSNRTFEDYELVMFTKHPLSLSDAQDDNTPFGKAHHTINTILNCIARYSADATLNPGETCEFPEDMEIVGGRCLIFDAYGPQQEHAEFGLLAVIEIHQSEMQYAMENRGADLIEKLKQAGYYPYSDLDRPAVV
jgi:hypothetical protein